MARDKSSLTIRDRAGDTGIGTPRIDPVAPPPAYLNTGPSGAEIAAQGFRRLLEGVGSFAAHQADQKIQAIKESREAGAADAALARTNQDRLVLDPDYEAAVRETEATAQTLTDETEIREALNDAIQAGDLATVRAQFDQMLRDRWQNADDAQVRVAAPWAQRLRSQLENETRAAAAKISHEENLGNFASAAIKEFDEARTDARDFNFNWLFQEARTLFGKDANTALVAALEPLIERDPRLLDLMPDTRLDPQTGKPLPSVKRTPGYDQKLQDAQDRGIRRVTEAKKYEREVAQFRVLDHYRVRILEGRYPTAQEVEKDVLAGTITAEKGQSILAAAQAERERRAKEAAERLDLSAIFAAGRSHELAGTIAREKQDDAFDAYVNGVLSSGAAADLSDEERLGLILSATERNPDFVHRPTASYLSNPRLDTPEVFDNQLSMFRQFYARSPAMARSFVKDDSAFRTYVSAMTLANHGYDYKQRFAALKDADQKKLQDQWTVSDLRKSALSRVKDMEVERMGRFFDADFSEFSNRGWVVQQYKDLVEAIGSTGLWDSTDQLLEAADRMMEAKYVAIGNVVVPRTPDMNHDTAWAWNQYLKRALPDTLKEHGLTPRDVELRPTLGASADRQSLTFYLKGTWQPVMPGFKLTHKSVQDWASKNRNALAQMDMADSQAIWEYLTRFDSPAGVGMIPNH